MNRKYHVPPRKSRKIIITAAAVLLAVLLPASDLMQVSAAADVFSGVKNLRDTLISSADGEAGTYNIVEVADTQKDATLGYLAGGSEPFRKFDSILAEENGMDTNPINSLGSTVTRLQAAGLLPAAVRADDLASQAQYPLAYDVTAYNGDAPGADTQNGYRVNEKAGLAGRDLVKGWYVKSDSGKYYENTVSGDASTEQNVELTENQDAIQAVYLAVNGTVTLTLPSGLVIPYGYKVQWSSAKKGIADCTAAESGGTAEITGVSYGRTYITAAVVSEKDASDVKKRYFGVVSVGSASDIKLEIPDSLLAKEDTLVLKANVPDEFASAQYTWSISDLTADDTAPVAEIYDPSQTIYLDEVAKTVDPSKLTGTGVELSTSGNQIGIYGNNFGTAQLELSASLKVDGIVKTYETTCKITVSDSDFMLDPDTVTVSTDAVSGKLTALIGSSWAKNAADITVTWSIANPAIASVTDAEGNELQGTNHTEAYVKGLKAGKTEVEATCTVTDSAGVSASETAQCDITVSAVNSQKFQIQKAADNTLFQDAEMYVGQRTEVKAVPIDSEYTLQDCVWSVTDMDADPSGGIEVSAGSSSSDFQKNLTPDEKGSYHVTAAANLQLNNNPENKEALQEAYSSNVNVYAGAITLLQNGQEVTDITSVSGISGSTSLAVSMAAGDTVHFDVKDLLGDNKQLQITWSGKGVLSDAALNSNCTELTLVGNTVQSSDGTQDTITIQTNETTAPSLTITVSMNTLKQSLRQFKSSAAQVASTEVSTAGQAGTEATTGGEASSGATTAEAASSQSSSTDDAAATASSADETACYIPMTGVTDGRTDNSGFLSQQAEAFGIRPLMVKAAESNTADSTGNALEKSENAVLIYAENGTIPADTTKYIFQTAKPTDNTDCFAGYGYATYTIYNNEWFKKYVFGMADESGETALDKINVNVSVIDLSKGFSASSQTGSQTSAGAESMLGTANMVYLSADGLVDNELSANTTDASETQWDDDTDSAADQISDLPISCAKIIVEKTWKKEAQSDNLMAGIVDYNIYGNRDKSQIAQKLPVLYQTALMLLSDQRKTLTADLSNIADQQWQDKFKSYTESDLIKDDSPMRSKQNYVLNNIYAVSYDREKFQDGKAVSYPQVMSLINQDFVTDYTEKEINQGFQEVYQHIIEENANRSNNGEGSIATSDVDPARVIQYIMTYSSQSDPIYKTKISVLEIEPCYAFKYYASDANEQEQAERAEAFAEKYAPQFAKYSHDDNILSGILNQISITGMSTAQFCGEVSDITQDYDLIYIGTQLVNTDIKQGNNTDKKDTIQIMDDTSDPVMNIYSETQIPSQGPSDTLYISVNSQRWEWDGTNHKWLKYVYRSWPNNSYGYESNQGVPGSLVQTWNNITYNWNGNIWYTKTATTQYNDTDMNGIIYSHMGDKVADKNLYQTELRYSGNDILSIQQKSLMNFLKLNYPVIVDDNLMKWSFGKVSGISAGKSAVSTVSGSIAGTLDNCSVMYDFVKEAYGDGLWNARPYQNFLTASEAAAGGVADWLNRPKLTINMTAQPTPYVPSLNGNILNPDSSAYLTRSSDGNYYLDYDLSISDVANVTPVDTTYRLQLYLDNNADGRFTGSTDDGKSTDETGRATEEITGLSVTDSAGNAVPADALSAYRNYHVRRQLPEGYVGSIGWKLKVTSNTASGTTQGLSSHDSVTGMTAVVPDKGDEADVYILQITSAFTTNGRSYSDLAAFDLAYQMNYNPSGTWAQMLRNIPGYRMHIISITNVDFADSYKYHGGKLTGSELQNKNGSVVWGTKTGFDVAAGKPSSLDDYDMVIVGFEDGFPNIPSAAAVKALVAYGKSGKSMLFTHDTTSWIPDPTVSPYNSKLNSEKAGGSYTTNTVRTSSYDGFASSYLSCAIRDLIGMDRYNYVGNNNLTGMTYSTVHDNTYKPDSGKTSFLEKLGTTYATTKSGALQYVYKNKNVDKAYQGANWASKVNEGAISSYPYVIPDTLRISNTHAQYYQLNLDMDNDSDGDSDLTVWYTLSSKDSGSYNPYDYTDLYETSPKDVRNNYYIYNRGSITYSGVGHSAVTDTVNEMQLFINTMVLSYNAGVRRPKISIMDSTFAQSKNSDSIPYDDAVDSGKEDTDYLYPVYFKAEDLNVDSNQHDLYISYSFGLGSDASYDATPSTAVQLPPGAYKTYLTDAEGNQVGEAIDTAKPITSGQDYCVMVPLASLSGGKKMTASDTLDFYVSGYVKLTKNGVTTTSSVDTDKMTIMHQQLFNLD